MVEIWHGILGDLEAINVRTAVADLVSRSKFPPCVAEVRDKAVSLSEGTLAPPTGAEAWERVLDFCGGNKEIQLSEDERRALRVIGGTWSVKNSRSSSFDRKDFFTYYESFVAKRRLEKSALPAVAALAEINAPKELPEYSVKCQDCGERFFPYDLHKGLCPECQPRVDASPERVSELLDGITGFREEG